MNETNSEGLADSEKPVQVSDNVPFPPFPAPADDDFEEDISKDERSYYITKFKDLNTIIHMKVHCTACDRHIGICPKNESNMKTHPMLRTLMCQNCHSFYNSGEFEKGDDGSELYCRWCGQGGQVYCCSDCPHVFCAKCIKRNMGPAKIREIEEVDDWKCFKCNTTCLRDLRAICWAALRYCDFKNRIAYKTEDAKLKESYLKEISEDVSECCRSKNRKKEKLDAKKKEAEAKKAAVAVVSKLPPTILVKKFASINSVSDVNKPELRKAQKRSASPKMKPNIILKNPICVSPKVSNTFHVAPMKKVRLPSNMMNPIRILNERKPVPQNTLIKIRPKANFQNNMFNGISTSTPFNNVMFNNDNINLSLDSLTQGLDMSSIQNMSGASQDELVCTPDFPMEPLCEVTEDNTDDDVQCITPGPVITPKTLSTQKPIVLSEVSPENIIQMTENDVTVNSVTGGLKFRVDPQTLSSNKMYRLPDGRIFAINANPTMPGGYSATIVAVTETNRPKISSSNKSSRGTPPPLRVIKSNPANRKKVSKHKSPKPRRSETTQREADLSVPVEWYRYNLIDAIDALEYSLTRLHKLKKEANTSFLRTRTVNEMRNLHRSFDTLLNTSSHRFKEIRDTLTKGFKQYLIKKCQENSEEEDDDDVEILPDLDEDPICIDENSLDSFCNETQEVDLTEVGSEHNDSREKSAHMASITQEIDEHDTKEIISENSEEIDTSKDIASDAKLNGKKSAEPKISRNKSVSNSDTEFAFSNSNSTDSKVAEDKNEKDENKTESEIIEDTPKDKKEIVDSKVTKTVKTNEKGEKVTNGNNEDINVSDNTIDDCLNEGEAKEASKESVMDISDDVKES
ncbi:uncharacterized protein LOC123715318 [Pieris brassicae]|uniref:PHD-type domain-containing protein n=1 Tax=Pieris brassicae TaxID=7116 RepID=A0A9P0TJK0_PIEBR|nr:uncharacterized protein LOC123715318 [Pieris brassicae]CAH4033398.1 unnamed protein product [Pieris brassicae]